MPSSRQLLVRGERRPPIPRSQPGGLPTKVPVFDAGDRLRPETQLPVDIEIPCDVLERTVDRAGNRSSLVRLGFTIEDQRGRTTFHVDEQALILRF